MTTTTTTTNTTTMAYPRLCSTNRTRSAVFGCLIVVICTSQAYLAVGFAFPVIYNRQSSSSSRHYLQTQSDEISKTYASPIKPSNIDNDILSQLNSCSSKSRADKILSRALSIDRDDDNSERLYNSISIPQNLSSRSISDAELALQTRTIQSKYKIYELIEQNGDRDVDRASLAVLCTFLAGATSAILAQQTTDIYVFGTAMHIPDIFRFVLVWILSFSPLIIVGYGLAVPENLSAVLITIQRSVFPSYRKRMIQHEAGHFLVGHLLGWPVKSYSVGNAVKNAVEFYPLSDRDVGKDRAEALGFNVKRGQDDENVIEPPRNEKQPYFSKEGRGSDIVDRSVFRDETIDNYSLPTKDNPTSSWPFRGFDDATLDKLAVISVAGACAEILAFGNAEGGVADLVQLRQIYGAAASSVTKTDREQNALSGLNDDASRRRLQRGDTIQTKVKSNGSSGMDEKEMDNRTKFALGFAMVLLRSNLGALDALAGIMEQGGSVSECIVAIETCPNVRGVTLQGDYDKLRRETFRGEGSGFGGWIENLFLGGGKTIDAEESGVMEGKGGGERKKRFELTGDDPFYAAIAVALAFFAWASNGGVSLH